MNLREKHLSIILSLMILTSLSCSDSKKSSESKESRFEDESEQTETVETTKLPELSIQYEGNKTFYFDNNTINYEIRIDNETQTDSSHLKTFLVRVPDRKSLADLDTFSLLKSNLAKPVAINGSLTTQADKKDESLILGAYYTFTNNDHADTIHETVVLRDPSVEAEDFDNAYEAKTAGGKSVEFLNKGAYILFKQIDLSDISRIKLKYSAESKAKLEIKDGSLDGSIISTFNLDPTKGNSWKEAREIVNSTRQKHDLYFVISEIDNNKKVRLDQIFFQFEK